MTGLNEWKRACTAVHPAAPTKEPAINPKPQRPLSDNFKWKAMDTVASILDWKLSSAARCSYCSKSVFEATALLLLLLESVFEAFAGASLCHDYYIIYYKSFPKHVHAVTERLPCLIMGIAKLSFNYAVLDALNKHSPIWEIWTVSLLDLILEYVINKHHTLQISHIFATCINK